MKPIVINLSEISPVLSTRESGRDLADRVEEGLRSKAGVILNFRGVQIVTPSFLDEILTRAAGVLRAPESGLLVATGVSDEVGETLELVLNHRKMMLATLEDEHTQLLGGPRQLDETLKAAHKLKEFTAADLARELKLKLPNLHQRLKALEQAGAVAKSVDGTVTRGKRYVWNAPPNDFVKPDAVGGRKIAEDASGDHLIKA